MNNNTSKNSDNFSFPLSPIPNPTSHQLHYVTDESYHGFDPFMNNYLEGTLGLFDDDQHPQFEFENYYNNIFQETPNNNSLPPAQYFINGDDEGLIGHNNNNNNAGVELFHIGNDVIGKDGNGENPEQIGGRGRRGGKNKFQVKEFGDRSSKYRGVSKFKNRDCFEAFLWDNTNPGENPKTVYIGGFEQEDDAARAYDLAALKLWGMDAPTNFPLEDYAMDIEDMRSMSKREYLLEIRRSSLGFAKGTSNYRGVSRNSDYKKWQARIGKGKDMRPLYLGTFETQEEAARAYDVAVIRIKGTKAVTNFDLSNYDVQGILESPNLPAGKGAAKLLKKSSKYGIIQKNTKGWRASPRLQSSALRSSVTRHGSVLERIALSTSQSKMIKITNNNPKGKEMIMHTDDGSSSVGLGVQQIGGQPLFQSSYDQLEDQIQNSTVLSDLLLHDDHVYQNPNPIFPISENLEGIFQEQMHHPLQAASDQNQNPSSFFDPNFQTNLSSLHGLSTTGNEISGVLGNNNNEDYYSALLANGGNYGDSVEGSNYHNDFEFLDSWLETFLMK